MIFLTIILFALAAAVGVLILKNWLTAAPTSKTVVYVHGAFAAAGLLLLVANAVRNTEQAFTTSLIFLVLAAVGGFYMFFSGRSGRNTPVWLALVHSLLAVTGFVFLVL